jgi:hypothetical protein
MKYIVNILLKIKYLVINVYLSIDQLSPAIQNLYPHNGNYTWIEFNETIPKWFIQYFAIV